MGTPGGRRSGNCRWMHQCWRWSLVDASPIAVERLQRETRALPCRVSIAFARARTLATAVSGSIASSSWTPTPTPPLLANHRDRTLSLVNCLPTRTQSGTTGFRRKLLLHGENVPATRRTESRKRLNIFSYPPHPTLSITPHRQAQNPTTLFPVSPPSPHLTRRHPNPPNPVPIPNVHPSRLPQISFLPIPFPFHHSPHSDLLVNPPQPASNSRSTQTRIGNVDGFPSDTDE